MKLCTKHFTITMGLSCVYIIERRMVEGAGILLLDDIYSYWRIDKSDPEVQPIIEDTINTAELLRVNESAVIKSPGRPPGAKNKRKRTR